MPLANRLYLQHARYRLSDRVLCVDSLHTRVAVWLELRTTASSCRRRNGTVDDTLQPSYETLVSTASGEALAQGMVSIPRPISFEVQGGGVCHAVLYPPTNSAYAGSSNDAERPPCIVSAHGGPTALAFQGFSMAIQFWTSRGWAWYVV